MKIFHPVISFNFILSASFCSGYALVHVNRSNVQQGEEYEPSESRTWRMSESAPCLAITSISHSGAMISRKDHDFRLPGFRLRLPPPVVWRRRRYEAHSILRHRRAKHIFRIQSAWCNPMVKSEKRVARCGQQRKMQKSLRPIKVYSSSLLLPDRIYKTSPVWPNATKNLWSSARNLYEQFFPCVFRVLHERTTLSHGGLFFFGHGPLNTFYFSISAVSFNSSRVALPVSYFEVALLLVFFTSSCGRSVWLVNHFSETKCIFYHLVASLRFVSCEVSQCLFQFTWRSSSIAPLGVFASTNSNLRLNLQHLQQLIKWCTYAWDTVEGDTQQNLDILGLRTITAKVSIKCEGEQN